MLLLTVQLTRVKTTNWKLHDSFNTNLLQSILCECNGASSCHEMKLLSWQPIYIWQDKMVHLSYNKHIVGFHSAQRLSTGSA